MDKDRIKGVAEQAKGAVKETAGKVTGDAKLESPRQRRQGSQSSIGDLKDTLRGK
jgi:uncharacterized protein YjbJ (UPF0337 family)